MFVHTARLAGVCRLQHCNSPTGLGPWAGGRALQDIFWAGFQPYFQSTFDINDMLRTYRKGQNSAIWPYLRFRWGAAYVP